MMIVIYIAKFGAYILYHIHELDKIKIMGFHQPPSTIIFDDPPYPNDTPKFYRIYIKRCVNDVKTITLKRLAQFIGLKALL